MYTREDGVIRLKYVGIVTTQETNQICLDGDLHLTVKLKIILSLFSDTQHIGRRRDPLIISLHFHPPNHKLLCNFPAAYVGRLWAQAQLE
jgi:hypothetical protein